MCAHNRYRFGHKPYRRVVVMHRFNTTYHRVVCCCCCVVVALSIKRYNNYLALHILKTSLAHNNNISRVVCNRCLHMLLLCTQSSQCRDKNIICCYYMFVFAVGNFIDSIITTH
eukprot:GHVS01088656.1.p1 GENE.GHVS01088656.1~~GHVS01088656.1.p1  ORF type:complete len:114 (+),score=24.09 GHVS01088656.1:197-538(+)